MKHLGFVGFYWEILVSPKSAGRIRSMRHGDHLRTPVDETIIHWPRVRWWCLIVRLLVLMMSWHKKQVLKELLLC